MPGPVDEGTDRGLHEQPDDTTDGQDQPDTGWVPARHGQQVDAEERPEPGLDIGEEEVGGPMSGTSSGQISRTTRRAG
ncbi:MAG: hypothetical protein ABIZ05_12905 [Pseudonocardiaceae bacterium]